MNANRIFFVRIFFLAIWLPALLSSCHTYKIFPKEYRDFTYSGEKKKAVVINPELSTEFKILKKAGIFQLTSDSLDDSAIKIKLYPLKRNFACGEPLLGSLITLGQVPVLIPDRYYYKFDEINDTAIIQKNFELQIATQYWFWDMFAFRKDFNQKAGQTLLAKYYSN